MLILRHAGRPDLLLGPMLSFYHCAGPRPACALSLRDALPISAAALSNSADGMFWANVALLPCLLLWLAGVPLVSAEHPRGRMNSHTPGSRLLPHIADGAGYPTEFVLFNQATAAPVGSLEFFGQ